MFPHGCIIRGHIYVTIVELSDALTLRRGKLDLCDLRPADDAVRNRQNVVPRLDALSHGDYGQALCRYSADGPPKTGPQAGPKVRDQCGALGPGRCGADNGNSLPTHTTPQRCGTKDYVPANNTTREPGPPYPRRYGAHRQA